MTIEMAAAPIMPRLAAVRVAIGLAQGVGLWLLYAAAEAHQWPATLPVLFVPALLILWFVPILATSGFGNLRLATLIAWLGVATIILAGLAVHDVVRDVAGLPFGALVLGAPTGKPGTAFLGPSNRLAVSVFFLLFIAHSLVSAADPDRRLVANYRAYFDVAWKFEVQVVLAAVFVGLFWLVLWLGAQLFVLINVHAIQDLIRHRWFATPASTLAFAYALHVVDVRVGLAIGMRNLLHVLLSWLLPLALVLVAGFLLTLPFTGLATLWSTKFSASLLFTAAAILIVLVNTAYREGAREAPAILRHAGSLACVCLVPLVVLAGYGLALRVMQHGWTADRVGGTAVLFITACYTVGYVWAAFPHHAWLKPLERCNVIVAFITVATILALLTPVADPDRIAVDNQVGRLAEGRIAPDQFDFAYLRFRSGQYGRAAFEKLRNSEAGANADEIRRRAGQAANSPNGLGIVVPDAGEIAAHINVYPRDHALPKSFVQQNWNGSPQRFLFPACLVNNAQNCEAFFADLDGDGTDEIILAEGAGVRKAVAFKQQADGTWQMLGTFSSEMRCESVREKLRSGTFTLEPPPAPMKQVVVGDLRLRLTPTVPFQSPTCP